MNTITSDLMHPQLRTIFQLSEDSIIILDTNYRIVAFNEAAKSLLHWKESDMLGISLDLIYKNHHYQVPFPLSKYKMLKKGISFTFNYVMYRSQSKKYITWKYLNQPNQSIYIIVGKDNTEKKRLALQSFTIFDQIKKIAACVPGNFYWKNKEAQYLGCNQTLLNTLGFKNIFELVGKTDSDLWPEYADELKKNDQLVIQEKKPIFLEETVNIDGKKMFFTVIKMPLLDDEGEIIGILGNSLDITDIKKIQQDLHEAKELAENASYAKSEFIANMSHDIRTPLTGVVGMSKILEDNILDPAQKEYAKWLSDSAKQLLTMLNDILEVVSADNSNKQDVRHAVFNLHDMIQDIIQLERPSIINKSLEFEVYVDELIPKSLINDATKIHRILLNLLGNAIKFTERGKIGLSLKLLQRTADQVRIQFCISDTGIGIPLELQDKVFERFYRVVPSHKGIYSGYGVGLHIAQTYVNLLGGHIQLDSQLDKGTTFSFTLAITIDKDPIYKSNLSQSTSCSKHINQDSDLKTFRTSPKILLVEDNKVALFTLENLVTQAGLCFSSVMDGETALELVKSHPFDLIITDLGLPGLSGIELTQQIRLFEKDRQTAPIPIIGLTAHSEERIKHNCLEAGMNEMYTKPMTKELLTDIKNIYFAAEMNASGNINTVMTSNAVPTLGPDLPDTESDLFRLDSLSIFDVQSALMGMGGNFSLLKSILKSIIEKEIPSDLVELKQAYLIKDWVAIANLAHRMKSGFVYCGVKKLVQACQYLERYIKAGHLHMLEALYQQLLEVIADTRNEVNRWLLTN